MTHRPLIIKFHQGCNQRANSMVFYWNEPKLTGQGMMTRHQMSNCIKICSLYPKGKCDQLHEWVTLMTPNPPSDLWLKINEHPEEHCDQLQNVFLFIYDLKWPIDDPCPQVNLKWAYNGFDKQTFGSSKLCGWVTDGNSPSSLERYFFSALIISVRSSRTQVCWHFHLAIVSSYGREWNFRPSVTWSSPPQNSHEWVGGQVVCNSHTFYNCWSLWQICH